MKPFFTSLLFLLFSITVAAQVPGLPFNPVTANGARHTYVPNNQYFSFKLFWENPVNVSYNDIYFSPDSNLVINMDSSALIFSGYDSLKVLDSLSLGVLDYFTKYYWRVVEHNSSGYADGPVWYFISQCYVGSFWDDEFGGGLLNYTIIQPSGASWEISNSNHAGGQPPEMDFWNVGFSGTAYLILNTFFDLTPSYNPLSFNYSVDFYSGDFTIGVAYSLDEGNNWTQIWQQDITGTVPATQVYVEVPNENYVKLALFCTDNDLNSFAFWYLDNLLMDTPLTVSTPPDQIRALAGTDSLKVSLSWSPGYTVNPSWGYRIQRKNGLAMSPSAYFTIANVGPSVLSYEDYNVQLDSTYTYRIQEKEGPSGGWHTTWSNEATAYVPAVTPVELQTFFAEVSGNYITLNWVTSTETNNLGFEIQKRQLSGEKEQAEWKNIEFTAGNGTTTEIHTYTYTDKKPGQGNLQYRLKQTDLNGSFRYSGILNVTVSAPKEFYLSQNYPNPFNPSTTIKYQVPEMTKVKLTVYDVLGEEIATLVNGEKPAGSYEVNFNAAGLPSGIYFFKLTADPFVQIKKMILLK